MIPAPGLTGGDDEQSLLADGRADGAAEAVLPTDAKGRPLKFFMTAGQVSDYTGAAALLGSLPAAEWMIADRGYDADWFRDALKDNLSLEGPLWANGAKKRSGGLSSRLFSRETDRCNM